MENAFIEQSELIKYPHAFSTRMGGVSTGSYESLNLGMNRGDKEDLVKENWRRFLIAACIPETEFVCGNQVHSNNVVIATRDDLRPAYGPGLMNTADGYVTSIPGVPLAIFTADCAPLLLSDEVHSVIGAIHCGWRSTVADIEGEAVQKMLSLGAKASDIKAAIGPTIGICCFEVGPEVIEAVQGLLNNTAEARYELKRNGKYMLDLRGVIKERLMQLGLYEDNIEYVGGCTSCHPALYWSHRGTGGKRGSLASIIEIPDKNQD